MSMASFRHQANAAVSAAAVWKRLQEPETWATVAGVESTSEHLHDGDELAGFSFTTRIGGMTYRGAATVTEARREEAMTLAVRTGEMTGAITVDLTPEPSGTRLDVAMQMRPVGMFGSIVFPVVRGAVAEGFDASVERLAQSMG